MLKNRIIEEIHSQGPMPIDRYMELCNMHYYSTRDPLGAAGDFITAPEICQVFGEIIAIWAITQWDKLGRPQDCAVLELGPGRGTLMADFLRAIEVMPEFKPQVHFVELSPALIEIQKKNVENATWHRGIPKLDVPTIAIANEFFDTLPIKQFIGKQERLILEEDSQLHFSLPADEGRVIEIGKLGEDVMKRISAECAAGVIIDYGYKSPQGIDTLQAVRKHKYFHPLQEPGEADLTALVDFQALELNSAKKCNIMTQGEFLLKYGGVTRAKMLGLEQDFDRLINPEQMGELFKVLCF